MRQEEKWSSENEPVNSVFMTFVSVLCTQYSVNYSVQHSVQNIVVKAGRVMFLRQLDAKFVVLFYNIM